MNSKKTILVVDDEHLVRWSLGQDLTAQGYDVSLAASAEEALELIRKSPPDLALIDIRLPRMSGLELVRELKTIHPETIVITVTAFGEVEGAVQAIQAGAADYLVKPFEPAKLSLVLKKVWEARELQDEVRYLKSREERKFRRDALLGEAGSMKSILETIAKLGEIALSSVLITGETGTGKELVARTLHYRGRRRDRPFVELNCGVIPENLIESELFGHERGAFTGAVAAKKGLLEIADSGTLFLDEIGELPLKLQVKLLKVLEDRIFRRVGGVRDVGVDIQVIAATNRNLETLIAAGEFREDLYFRLNVIPIAVPPLRERGEDVLLIGAHFLREFATSFRKPARAFSEAAKRAMVAHRWPGNVRELRNVIERAVLLEEVAELGPEHIKLPAPALPSAGSGADTRVTAPFPSGGLDLESHVAEYEKSILRQALLRTSGNQTAAAKLLQINRDALRYKLKKFNMDAE